MPIEELTPIEKLRFRFKLIIEKLVELNLVHEKHTFYQAFDANHLAAIESIKRVLEDMYTGERFSKIDEGRIHLMENNLDNELNKYLGRNRKPQDIKKPHIHVVIAISRNSLVETKRYTVRDMNAFVGNVLTKWLKDYDISNCRVNFHPGEQSAYETDTIVAHFDGIDHSGPEHKLRQRDPVNLTAYGCYCTGEFDNDGVAPF